MTPDRTAAAIEARRRAAEQKLQQVGDAVASLRRHKTPVTYPAVARAAGVSRTFLYANPDARSLISEAVSKDGRRKAPGPGTGAGQEPSWRERALNAEADPVGLFGDTPFSIPRADLDGFMIFPAAGPFPSPSPAAESGHHVDAAAAVAGGAS